MWEYLGFDHSWTVVPNVEHTKMLILCVGIGKKAEQVDLKTRKLAKGQKVGCMNIFTFTVHPFDWVWHCHHVFKTPIYRSD